jgi:hypothetical protein
MFRRNFGQLPLFHADHSQSTAMFAETSENSIFTGLTPLSTAVLPKRWTTPNIPRGSHPKTLQYLPKHPRTSIISRGTHMNPELHMIY